MCVQVALPFVTFPTHYAQMGSFPRVRHPVSLHVALPVEAPTTVCALVWPFPRVDPHVQSQSPALPEVHATLLTPVWLLPCVDPHVILQMARLFKTFSTDGTGVSSLPGNVIHIFFHSNNISSFTAQVLPFLWPRSGGCERLHPLSINHTFCSLSIFTLIHGVEGLRNSVAFSFSVPPLFLCCVKCLVGHSLVVPWAWGMTLIINAPLWQKRELTVVVSNFLRTRRCKLFHLYLRGIRVLVVLTGVPVLFSELLLIRSILLRMSDLKWICKDRGVKI